MATALVDVTLTSCVLIPLILTVPLLLNPDPLNTNDPPLYELIIPEAEVGAAVVTEIVEVQILHPYDAK